MLLSMETGLRVIGIFPTFRGFETQTGELKRAFAAEQDATGPRLGVIYPSYAMGCREVSSFLARVTGTSREPSCIVRMMHS